MNETQDLYALGVIPVIAIHDVLHTETLEKGLVDGGLPIAEVTFRTEAGPEVIRRLADAGNVLVGAGTIRTVDQVNRAFDAGAKFLVSPGFSKEVVERSQELSLPILPGTVTATEVMAAQDMGIDVLKFFPAGTSGGAAAIKALSAPFYDASFVPTGGIGLHNMEDYLKLPSVPAVGGSWMVPGDALAAGNSKKIAELCREAVTKAAHIKRD